jgi:hypothetical protein
LGGGGGAVLDPSSIYTNPAILIAAEKEENKTEDEDNQNYNQRLFKPFH